MVFKELEIQGFKSFPDKVRIRFDEGVTGVVGPNGSGKTTSKTLTFTMSAGTDTENGKRLCRQATAWLVVHARRYGIDSLRANGMRWNRTDGVWAGTETGDLTITATLA